MSLVTAACEPLGTSLAAQRLGVSPYTLIKWRSTGCGPAFSRRGRKIVYSLADIETYERLTRQVPGAASSVDAEVRL